MPWTTSPNPGPPPIGGGGEEEGAKKKWDGDGCPVEDSNMAGVGGEEDKAARKGAAATEPAWQGIGLEPGIWIWRIEEFKVVAWPKEQYGKFHEGDSYILLHCENTFDEEGNKTDKLDRDIHFWLGKKTSTDEKGTAAYKTVELDDFFDGEPTQHRECQGIESELFLSYFEKPLEYLPGGVDSGFKVVQDDIFMSKLIQVRRNAKKKIIFEEEAVALSSLNHRDAWILELQRKIYVWFGDSASAFVKNAANMRAEKMEQESNGEREAVKEVDDEFWAALGGGGPADVTPADQVGEEVEADFGEGVLYCVEIDDDRKLSVKEAGRGELKKSMLDSTNVMMLDTRVEIFMWLGSGSSNAEQKNAFATATNYLRSNKRDPDNTAIHVIKEGHEGKNPVWSKIFDN